MVRGHQSENVLQSKISMAVPAVFVLSRKKRPSACTTWHVPSRPAPEAFPAGSTLAAVEAAEEVQHQDTRSDEVPDRAPPADSNPPPAWPDSGRYLSQEAL